MVRLAPLCGVLRGSRRRRPRAVPAAAPARGAAVRAFSAALWRALPLALLTAVAGPAPARAHDSERAAPDAGARRSDEIGALRRELAATRSEIDRLQRFYDARLDELARRLESVRDPVAVEADAVSAAGVREAAAAASAMHVAWTPEAERQSGKASAAEPGPAAPASTGSGTPTPDVPPDPGTAAQRGAGVLPDVSAAAPAPAVARATAPAPVESEREIRLDDIPNPPTHDVFGTRVSGFVVGSTRFASGGLFPGSTPAAGGLPAFDREVEAPTDPGETNFRFDAFNIGLTRRFSEWLFATGSLGVERERVVEGFEGGRELEAERETRTEIDVFELTATAPVGNGLALSFGRFHVPFGIEREDAPFNLQATRSLVFELGRPAKVSGFRAAYQIDPRFDVQLFAVNGWDQVSDANGDKTYGGRLGFTPVSGLHLGVGGLFGPEQDGRNGPDRALLDVDALFTGLARLTLAGELVYGSEQDVGVFAAGEPEQLVGLDAAALPALVREKDSEWLGLAVTGHYDATDLLGLTLRYGYFDDRDGGRTGFEQALHSVTAAPVLHLSNLVPGLGGAGVVPRSRHPIPYVDLRFEYRADFSDGEVFFEEDDLSRFDDLQHRFGLQLIGMF